MSVMTQQEPVHCWTACIYILSERFSCSRNPQDFSKISPHPLKKVPTFIILYCSFGSAV